MVVIIGLPSYPLMFLLLSDSDDSTLGSIAWRGQTHLIALYKRLDHSRIYISQGGQISLGMERRNKGGDVLTLNWDGGEGGGGELHIFRQRCAIAL